jgi:tetratricopeptide (TPR) repeat protein
MFLSFNLQSRLKSFVFLYLCFAAWYVLSPKLALAYQTLSASDAPPVIEGKVSDSAGTLISGVLIRLEPESTGPSASSSAVSSAMATSDEGGKFRLAAPGPGHYILRASKANFQVLVVSDINLARGDNRRLDLVLQFSQSVTSHREAPLQTPKDDSSVPEVTFSDAPNFTVAGITDRSNMGLHGSDANVRTSDSLAKETVSLKSKETPRNTEASRVGDAHRTLGDSKEAAGDPVAAVKEYEAAVKADPSEQNYFTWGSELLLHRAGQAAAQVFSAGAKAHPDSSRMLAGLGAALYSNGQYNEAAAQLCRASDLNPADLAPYLFLGKMEQAAADPLPCSEPALSRFANQQPQNSQANFFYGLVLWKNARKMQDAANLARAEQLFQKAVTINPHFAEVYVQLGMLYNARGAKDSALASFQKAVIADPKSSQAHYQLSLVYRRAGDAAKADQELKTYDELRRSDDAALEKERRELRQFVTILQEGKSTQP